MHLNDVRLLRNTRDRHDVGEEVEGKLLVKRRIDGIVMGDQKQRTAIRLCVDHRLRRQVAARAGTVLDDERLTKPVLQPPPYQPGQNIRRPAGRESDDDAHGSYCRILGLGVTHRGYRERTNAENENTQSLHA